MSTPTYNGYTLGATHGSGSEASGYKVGEISAPQSIWDQLNSNISGFGDLTSSTTSNIQSLLNGTLSPTTQSNISNYAAARGVSTGQPNSALSNLIGMNITGTTTEALQQKGISDYNDFTKTVGSEQQDPGLLASIAEFNATNSASPDPASAASYAKSLFNESKNSAGYSQNQTGTNRRSNSNQYSGMGFNTQDGGSLNYGQTSSNPYSGIGTIYSTGSGNSGSLGVSLGGNQYYDQGQYGELTNNGGSDGNYNNNYTDYSSLGLDFPSGFTNQEYLGYYPDY